MSAPLVGEARAPRLDRLLGVGEHGLVQRAHALVELAAHLGLVLEADLDRERLGELVVRALRFVDARESLAPRG